MRELDYTRAARATGASTPRILVRHLLPNALPPLIVSAAFGVGVGDPGRGGALVPGSRTARSGGRRGAGSCRRRPAYIEEAWWIALFPGLALFLTVAAYNLLAEGLRAITTEARRDA